MRLFGREAECAALDEIVRGTRGGRSAALVLRGEAGVGKTALLRYAGGQAAEALWISGVESEADFPFAALHRLLIPLLPQRDRLPATQAAALEVACGLTDGQPADLFLVSLAALTLLAHTPRLCIVDDAQWLDRESLRALAFVGRRLHAEGVALLFGLRLDGHDPGLLPGLPVLDLHGLAGDPAAELLGEVVGAPVEPGLAAQIARATAGNPLALTDLGRELTAAQLSGAAPLPEPIPIGSRLERHYSARIRAYPAATRTWLLLAAADAGGTGSTLAAARRLGIGTDDAAPAESDGLIAGSPPLTFRHPLVRSAVYGGATSAQRRAAHDALAASTDPVTDADRRAWHLAAAATGPDEAVAAEVERSADRAQARGGHAARATFLARAAELTLDPHRKAGRRVLAAEAALTAGAPARALTLLDRADLTSLSETQRGAALMIRANAGASSGVLGANQRASAVCLAAAAAFGEVEPDRARVAALHAIEHEIAVEDLIRDTTQAQLATTAARLAGDRPASTTELLLAGWSAFVLGGFESGAPVSRRAVAAVTDPAVDAADLLRHVVVAVSLCTLLWDDRSRQLILDRGATIARQTGALQALDLIHFMAAMGETTLGRLTDADRHDAAGRRLRKAIGITAGREPVWRHPELIAWRLGRDERDSLRPALQAFETLGLGGMRSTTVHSLATADLGYGDYATARERLRPLVEPGRPGRHARVLPDLVEAALRSADRRTAQVAYADLALAVRCSGTPWAKGLLERSTALLADTAEDAEHHYREAIAYLTGTLAYGDLARAHLLYGEWLRRRRRRGDARKRLTTALEMFAEVRADAFVHRARQELRALGGSGRTPVPQSETALTPQEAAVARLARAGSTNAEIAAHLYLSASTVDYHLRKVYRKLRVRSRRQLRDALHD